jgi:hypothetical protein
MPKWVVDKKIYNSEKEAEQVARDILYSDNVGSYVSEKNQTFLLSYFKTFHWEWNQKNGCGIAKVKRISPDGFNNRCFEILRVDGTKTDISFIVSRIKSDNSVSDVNDAFRFIVSPQILEFKEQAFKNISTLICPVLGIYVTRNDCHIDHSEPSFETIVSRFKQIHRLNESEIVANTRDNQMRCEINSKEIRDLFFRYHYEEANLRVVSKKANLSNLKKK